MENLTIAFVGSGNIASSMIGGLITNGIDPKKLIAADSDKTQQQLIADKYGIRVYDKNYDAAKEADVIVFAVKPQIMQQVVKEISKNIKNNIDFSFGNTQKLFDKNGCGTAKSCVAELKNIAPDSFYAITTDNFFRLFKKAKAI